MHVALCARHFDRYLLGSRSMAVMIALAYHQCDPGSILSQCHMWFVLVVYSGLATRVFLPVPRFSSHQTSNIDQERGQA